MIRMPPSCRSARASRPMPASRRSSSGTRSQPPRPTTMAVSPAPAASSLRRPSRMCTVRSAIAVAAGSWLTRTTVAPTARGPARRSARRPSARRRRRARRPARRPGAARAVGDRRADGDALLLAARELRRAGVGGVGEPDALEQLGRPPGALGAGRAEHGELERRRSRGSRARAAASGGSAGRRSHASARAAPPRAARGRAAMSWPSTRADPADGRSSPARMRSSVLLPEPLGPSTATTSPRVDAERQALQRGGVALAPCGGCERGRGRRSRASSAASDPASTATGRQCGDREDGERGARPRRRGRPLRSGGTAADVPAPERHEVDHRRREHRAEHDAADGARDGEHDRPQQQVGAQRRAARRPSPRGRRGVALVGQVGGARRARARRRPARPRGRSRPRARRGARARAGGRPRRSGGRSASGPPGRRTAAAGARPRPPRSAGGGVPSQTSCGTAAPGASALTATESAPRRRRRSSPGGGEPGADRDDPGGDGLAAGKREVQAPPRPAAPPGRGSRPPGPARRRTAGRGARGRWCCRRARSGRPGRSPDRVAVPRAIQSREPGDRSAAGAELAEPQAAAGDDREAALDALVGERLGVGGAQPDLEPDDAAAAVGRRHRRA